MFDSHCHLHDLSMQHTHADALTRAAKAGVTGFMLAGVDPEDWRRGADLARRHPQCLFSYGVHPQWAATLTEGEAQAALEIFATAARGEQGWDPPNALGEMGLDHMTIERRIASKQQGSVFRAQLAIARELDKPIIVHILRAQGRALEILEADGVPKRGGVIHSYSGPAELIPRYEALGLHISFAGTVCHPNAKRARSAVRAVSSHRLLAETDTPFQTPLPHQPQCNEPAFLTTIIAAMAQARGEPLEHIARITADNSRTLFQR